MQANISRSLYIFGFVTLFASSLVKAEVSYPRHLFGCSVQEKQGSGENVREIEHVIKIDVSAPTPNAIGNDLHAFVSDWEYGQPARSYSKVIFPASLTLEFSQITIGSLLDIYYTVKSMTLTHVIDNVSTGISIEVMDQKSGKATLTSTLKDFYYPEATVARCNYFLMTGTRPGISGSN